MPSASSSQIPQQKIERQHDRGFHLTTFEQRGVREFHITIAAKPGEQLVTVLERVQQVLKDNEATIVKQQIFGPTTLSEENLRLVKLVFGAINWPVTWLEGAACNGAAIAGMHILAIAGSQVETIATDGRVFGCAFDDAFGRNLLLQTYPDDTFCSQASQVRQVYNKLEQVLHDGGMRFGNVIRTWFFLDQILSWYGDFNKVRNFMYQKRKKPFLPASTGVGVRNDRSTALALEAWAILSTDGDLKVSEVRSPLQCAAPKYGSGFSRAVEIETPGLRKLWISGTASIDEAGKSVHDGDMRKQIEETMQVVQAILNSRRQTFSDATRATAYVKKIEDAPCFTSWCADNGVELPMIITQADICRDELLFEIELDTIRPTN